MIKKVLILIIKLYQYMISPFIGKNCRFTPSCSNYAISALKVHGLIHGILLITMRLCKCNPYVTGGNDPVPPIE